VSSEVKRDEKMPKTPKSENFLGKGNSVSYLCPQNTNHLEKLILKEKGSSIIVKGFSFVRPLSYTLKEDPQNVEIDLHQNCFLS
jgi:hypothetical protein